MDVFRRLMDKRCGKGGVKCHCCNDFHGKSRKKLHRLVRRVLRQSKISKESD